MRDDEPRRPRQRKAHTKRRAMSLLRATSASPPSRPHIPKVHHSLKLRQLQIKVDTLNAHELKAVVDQRRAELVRREFQAEEQRGRALRWHCAVVVSRVVKGRVSRLAVGRRRWAGDGRGAGARATAQGLGKLAGEGEAPAAVWPLHQELLLLRLPHCLHSILHRRITYR